ncbi:hypothetical protein KL918_001843 [Ogataea parapolymorpha]|uniref:Chorismate synthase n=1 Tax=Ogataea parapolymorpha (strain ATCC 26012 / BCRC 20466 / JCM 22074 / NRRL Y-7560 / DL-1) TaxID=871575 RepID=W1QCI9_OGAPD|nr:Chorismate synthase [Ogataea parapolymorpha DL-1]ESW98766.1 Chorismate synthase [Ogataea parapolymorpha DL-1]KAG7868185.1 hypothetical protein KL918_001843 [Ogataea parapolymorpha]KAG7874195.1 hypothetical protein KL916_001535 [Ogataea parapolymorpha]
MSSFGTIFKVTTYGESHCRSVGCIVDGVPPNMSLTEDDIQPQLSRRRPGQSKLTTPRNEKDRVEIQSGTEFGKTLGTPIAMVVKNEDQRPKDYTEMDVFPRPSHADFTYLSKYGVKASSGGGRSSARETIGRVAAGAIAEKFLKQVNDVEIVAFVSGVGECQIDRSVQNPEFMELLSTITRERVDQSGPIRCPILEKADEMTRLVVDCKERNDSVGGIVTCVIRNVPIGLGEPAFDKLEAMLAHAMLSIPATKGFEIGSGFEGTKMRGSEHNDPFVKKGGKLGTATNNSGGIQGGISNGENIYFSVAFKPPATISQEQQTASYEGDDGVLKSRGRHDPNVVPRAIPIVEAMAALVLADSYLIQKSRESTFGSVY